MDDSIKNILDTFFTESKGFVSGLGTLMTQVRENLTPEQQKVIDEEMSKLDLSELNKSIDDLTKDIKNNLNKM